MTEEVQTEQAETEVVESVSGDVTEESGAEVSNGSVDNEGEQDGPTRKLRAEAKKYRTQLREVEAERDALTGRVEQMMTVQAEGALESVLSKPSSLWMTGAKVSDYFDDAGTLDRDRLETDARKAVDEHGLQRHSVRAAFAPGRHADPEVSDDRSFKAAFAPR